MRAILSTVVVMAAACGAGGAVVTFDTAASPANTTYQNPANPPTSLLFAEDGLLVRMFNFTSGAFTGFNSMTINPSHAPFATNSAGINNVQLRFDTSGLPFTVTQMTLQYSDEGGTNNVGANGTYIETGDLSSLPPTIGSVAVTSTANTITFTAPGGIQELIIGGQELWIDNVTAVPGPEGLALLGLGGLVAGRRRR